jgi:integrase
MEEERPFKASRRFSREKALEAFREIAPHKREYLLEAKAYRSTIQYASVWRQWKGRREKLGLPLMPATPEELEAWVWHLIEDRKMSPASIDSYVAAVATVHRYHGYAIDRTLLIEPLKAARRQAGPPRRARALVGEKLQALVATLDPKDPRDCRDSLGMLLGWAMAGRSAEIVGLDWLRPGGRAYGGTGVLSRETKGLLVTLLKSKSSQVTDKEIPIPDAEMPSLGAWLDRWLDHAKVQGGEPLFRPITPQRRILPARLAADSVAKIVRKRMLAHSKSTGMSEADAILICSRFSSHSMRRGYCTTASNARIPLGQIRARSRHSSDAMLGKYIESAEGWNSSGLDGIGF